MLRKYTATYIFADGSTVTPEGIITATSNETAAKSAKTMVESFPLPEGTPTSIAILNDPADGRGVTNYDYNTLGVTFAG